MEVPAVSKCQSIILYCRNLPYLHAHFCFYLQDENDTKFLQYCSVCEGYKAPRSHHCRKCKYLTTLIRMVAFMTYDYHIHRFKISVPKAKH